MGLGAPTTAARRDLLPTVCRQLDILSKVSAPLFFCFWDLRVERGSKDAGDHPPNNESPLEKLSFRASCEMSFSLVLIVVSDTTLESQSSEIDN